MLTPEENRQRLPDPVFLEATGVLEMIARDPEQRSLYEARLKAERDSRANLDYALREGREQGREEGRWEERIRTVDLLRDIIGDPSPTDATLKTLSLEELATLETELQRRLKERSQRC